MKWCEVVVKRVIKCLVVLVIVFLMSGCDERPPTVESLESWLSHEVEDKYEIIKKDISGENVDTKIYFTLKSQYGFEFHASATMEYVEDDLFGNRYMTYYDTDYSEKFKDYNAVKIDALENKYENYLTFSDYTDAIYFKIYSYKDLTFANDFCYEMYKILGKYSPSVYIKFDAELKSLLVLYSDLMEDKNNHLNELRIYYIDLVQRKVLNDNTIPKMGNVTLNRFFINNVEIFSENDYIFYYLKKYDVYGTKFDLKETGNDLWKTILSNLGYSYYIDKENNIISYQIRNNKYEIILVDESLIFKKNNKIINNKKLSILYSPNKKMTEKSIFQTLVSLEDFANLVECDYKIVGNAVYFTN